MFILQSYVKYILGTVVALITALLVWYKLINLITISGTKMEQCEI